jgi:hypothetical protein
VLKGIVDSVADAMGKDELPRKVKVRSGKMVKNPFA